jgi:glycosyltransferase involved in cell wall biosynthesis
MSKPLTKSDISVAVIETVGGHGGMHFYDSGLCAGLLAAGCRVSLYTCDETTDPAVPKLGFYPFYRRIYGKSNRWLRGVHYISGTIASLKNATAAGATICHFHVFNDPVIELIVITMTKLFGMKIVLTVHDVDSLASQVTQKRRMTRWIYRLADRIIVHNKASQLELESIGLPSDRISVIAHGNYLESMIEMPSSAEARRALGIEASAKVVLFFGQIKDVKGLDLLIQALPIVAHEVPSVLLLIAGRPWKTEIARYDALIDELNVREKCRLHIGFVPDDEVSTYYAAAEVVALPYRRIYQSGVLLMAMTFGRPVVVSDLPGMTEIVADGVTGYVFLQGSKDDLAKALIRALKDEIGGQGIAMRASEYIRKHHNWNQIGAQTAQLYRQLLSVRE